MGQGYPRLQHKVKITNLQYTVHVDAYTKLKLWMNGHTAERYRLLLA